MVIKDMTDKILQKVMILTMLMIMVPLATLTACALPGFGQQVKSPIIEDYTGGSGIAPQRVDTGFVLTGPESYDSADTAVVADIDEGMNTVTFLNLDIGRRYTLSMDGTTKLTDKYGDSISLKQLAIGDIVDVTFLKSQKHLTTLKLSEKAWSYSSVERYELNHVRDEVTVGAETFKLAENALYVSDGRTIDQTELNAVDVLTFQGIDKTILSVTVEKGHGYLRLLNDENFIGGWIEIGQEQVQRISDDMLLTVPEGSYQVSISHNGGGGTKPVVINRNDETSLDIGDLTVAEVKKGMVLFSLTPSKATLYIDGSEVDASKPITLNYGIHQIIAKADGYKSLTQYIRVGQASAGLDVVLDAVDSDSKESSESSKEESSASSEEATTNYYKVYIDAPEKVEVYLDGNYMGISPCSFRKVSGSHEITLRKSGYETRTYTVQIDDEDRDISYSFVDLIAGNGSSTDESEDSSEEDDDDTVSDGDAK